MKPESDQLESRLRATTSLAPAQLDPELATLQDSFMTLGRSLEEATSARDEERLLAALRGSIAEGVVDRKPVPSASQGFVPTLLLLATLAAALLIAVGLAKNAFRSNPSVTDQIAQPTPREKTEKNASLPIVEDTSSTEELLAWDDSLEETFVSAQWRVQRAGSLASSADTDVDTLYERIQSAAEELDPASL